MITINDILNKVEDKKSVERINKAYLFALKKHEGKKRLSGDDYITHPLEVANILLDLNVDSETIMAALLHEVINNGDSEIAYEEIKKEFGEELAKIIDSISKINKLELNDIAESSAAYLRKILVGMAEDVRVLYVKLADRLHNMRTNWALDASKQKIKAKETMEILVPIAHRLGMNSIKSELENLCLQYLKPDVYNDILEKLNVSVEELNDELENMKANLSELLKDAGINFEIKGRVKSIYSIYKKLSTGRIWDDIYDILALRIFVDKESDCYAAVGIIHSKYRPISKRFKDFIASPKANLYQSLHTSVFGENGKLYEIQIRTYEMDEIAEKGVASHWSYKEKGSQKIQSMMEQKLELFRNIIESSINDNEFESTFETNFLNDLIYVYTPKGDVVELPKGSSPIDFAYRIHSNIGDTTVGAIVNDIIVPFTHELKDGDIVKIKTSTNAKPNKNWLNIVKTTQAKNKIKSYFSKNAKEEYILKGKNILEKELRKRKIKFNDIFKEENINKILKILKFKDEDDIYLSIGSLRHTASYIINLITNEESITHDAFLDKDKRKKSEKNSYRGDIYVSNEKNILINLAKCCHPIKGDEIIGYITKNQGITVHKKDCENIAFHNDRIINVQWNYDISNVYITNLYISISDNHNIISNLIELCTKKDIILQSFSALNNNILNISVQVKNNEQLEDFINGVFRIKHVKNVSKKIRDL